MCGSYTLVELSKGAATERWPAAVRGQLIGIAQTAIPSDVERPTSASVQATAWTTNWQRIGPTLTYSFPDR